METKFITVINAATNTKMAINVSEISTISSDLGSQAIIVLKQIKEGKNVEIICYNRYDDVATMINNLILDEKKNAKDN